MTNLDQEVTDLPGIHNQGAARQFATFCTNMFRDLCEDSPGVVTIRRSHPRFLSFQLRDMEQYLQLPEIERW